MHVTQRDRYAEALLNAGVCGAIEAPRHIVFASGLRSPVYLDNRRLLSHPRERSAIVRGLTFLIEEVIAGVASFDKLVLAAVESGGTPHTALVADELGLPMVTVRKAEKDHGKKKRIEGGEVEGKQVVLIEDHITTAGSALSAAAALSNAGAHVLGLCAITQYDFRKSPHGKSAAEEVRERGLKYHVLVDFFDLLDLIERQQRWTPEEIGRAAAWLRDPAVWSAAQAT